MFYFFHRDSEVLRCEIRQSVDGDGYEIAMTERNGSERIERHPTSIQVHHRWLELHRLLESEGWQGPVTQDGRG